MTAPLTNTNSKNPFKLCPCAANLKHSDLLPYNEKNGNTVTKVFLRKIVELLLDHLKKIYDRNEKIMEYQNPTELESVMDLNMPQKSMPLQQILNDCHQSLQHAVKSGHPRFFNNLNNGLDVISLAGDWFASVCNAQPALYENATIFTIMEDVVFKHMRSIIGWEAGESTLCPGGSIANLYAVLIARYKLNKDVKERGMKAFNQPLLIFASNAGHYSMKKAAMIVGIGALNFIQIKTDDNGRMDCKDLETKIGQEKKRGGIPFMVVCTYGTPISGAFDDVQKCDAIAKTFKMWHHVDATIGGGLLMSKKHRRILCEGIEMADSVTWCPDKLMGISTSCATIHFKEEGLLENCLSTKSPQLFMEDKVYSAKYDTGDKTIQSSRTNDIFKLWLTWRARGDEGFEKHVDRCMELTQYLARRIKDQVDKFVLIIEPVSTSCCFLYMSKRLRDTPDGNEKRIEMGKLCAVIKAKMMAVGSLMLSYVKDETRPYNYFRCYVTSASSTEKDFDFLLSEVDRLGQDL